MSLAPVAARSSSDASLYLHSVSDGHFRQLAVLIDGQFVGSVMRGETARFALAPGRCLLVLRPLSDHEGRRISGWPRSRGFVLELVSGGASKLVCGSAVRSRFLRPWLGSSLVVGLAFAALRQAQMHWWPGVSSVWLAVGEGMLAAVPGQYAKSWLQARCWPVWIKPAGLEAVLPAYPDGLAAAAENR